MIAPEAFTAPFIGRRLSRIHKLDWSWFFEFGEGCSLTTQSYWRVIAHGGLAVSESDHEQQFGLPAPVDAGAVAFEMLKGEVVGIEITDAVSDIRLTFADGPILELLNTSCGYEGWQLFSPPGTEIRRVIALGGGTLSLWDH